MMQCEKCLAMQPSLKTMQIHYENKHPKDNWEEAYNLHYKEEEEE